MSHVTYEWMSPIHTNETCHIWMCHVTCKCIQSHTRIHILLTSLSSLSYLHFLRCLHQHRMSRVKYKGIMSRIHKSRHTRMHHVTQKWFTCLFVCRIDQYRASHVTRINENCDIWMRHVTHEWVMSLTFAFVVFMSSCESWNVCEWAGPHMYESSICVAVCCSWSVAVCCNWCVAVCCSVLQLVCCSVLQLMCCSICINRIKYKCVMSHMNVSCHIWMRHVT